MIDRGGIQWAAQRTRHHVVALGAVLAAHVLNDADVTAFENHFESVVIAVKAGSEMGTVRASGEIVGVVGRARKKYGSVFGAFGHENDGVQFQAVAHGNHHVAACVVETAGDRSKLRRRFTGQRSNGRSLSLCEEETAEHRHEQSKRANAVERFHPDPQ